MNLVSSSALVTIERVSGLSTIAPDDPCTGLSHAQTRLLDESDVTRPCALLLSRTAATARAAFVYIVRLHVPSLTGGCRAVDLEIVVNHPTTLDDLVVLASLIRELLAPVIYDRTRSPELASLQLADVINLSDDTLPLRDGASNPSITLIP